MKIGSVKAAFGNSYIEFLHLKECFYFQLDMKVNYDAIDDWASSSPAIWIIWTTKCFFPLAAPLGMIRNEIQQSISKVH
jgi:hypothetical protein